MLDHASLLSLVFWSQSCISEQRPEHRGTGLAQKDTKRKNNTELTAEGWGAPASLGSFPARMSPDLGPCFPKKRKELREGAEGRSWAQWNKPSCVPPAALPSAAPRSERRPSVDGQHTGPARGPACAQSPGEQTPRVAETGLSAVSTPPRSHGLQSISQELVSPGKVWSLAAAKDVF